MGLGPSGMLLGQALPYKPSLNDALAAFAPPHHQRSHQQGDEDGHQDEGAEDAVGGVTQRPARRGAVPEVVAVDSNEELIHQAVGPVASEVLSHRNRAVRQLPVGAHGLIPVAPQPLPDALHAELEGPEAALTDLPAVLRLMACRRRDEVMGQHEAEEAARQQGHGQQRGARLPPRRELPRDAQLGPVPDRRMHEHIADLVVLGGLREGTAWGGWGGEKESLGAGKE